MNNWSSNKIFLNQIGSFFFGNYMTDKDYEFIKNINAIKYRHITCVQQCVGRNDKKWALLDCLKKQWCLICPEQKCIVQSRFYFVFKAANTRYYTPEQQEMLDWLNNLPYHELTKYDVENKYIEIINKHK
jgi:hypothetical protein